MFDRFRAEPFHRQVLAVTLGVLVIAVLLGGLWYGLLYTPYQMLFSGLRTADAATIVAELDRRKIPYRLSEGGTAIEVPADLVDSTRLDVMSQDLPLKGTVGLELFDKSDMGLTDFAQKINYQRALQGELERTIMTLDGVDQTRVHISMGEDRIFRDDRVPPKASVEIRMHKGAALSPGAALGVRRLVAAAVPKLDIANVVILDEHGMVVDVPQAASPAVATIAPALQEKHAIEDYYAARIREALDRAPLGGPVDVAVEAILPADGTDAALASWTPVARAFALQVTLSTNPPLDPAAQAAARAAVAAATGPTAQADDGVNFAAAVPADSHAGTTGPPPVARPLALPGPAPEGDGGWLAEAAVAAAVLLLLLLGVGLVLRSARKPRRLDARERADFALRLRAALAQGDGHVASRP